LLTFGVWDANERAFVEESHCGGSAFDSDFLNARIANPLCSLFGVHIVPECRLVVEARQSDVRDLEGFSKGMPHLGCVPPKPGPGIRVLGHDASRRSTAWRAFRRLRRPLSSTIASAMPEMWISPTHRNGGQQRVGIVSEASRCRGIAPITKAPFGAGEADDVETDRAYRVASD